LEARLHEKISNQTFRKPFEKVEIEVGFFMTGNKMETRTYSRAVISLRGQKKKESVNILHSFCPFCGEKTIKDAEVPE
jgi:hypothetical protein